MSENKTYVIGEVATGSIDTPFVLNWSVKTDSKCGSTDVVKDTAINAAPLSELMPMGETVGTTQNTGGPGELADTSFSV